MYRTFKRSASNSKQFSAARKMTVDTCLTLKEAQKQCEDYNNNRTPAQIRKGTKMEFDRQA